MTPQTIVAPLALLIVSAACPVGSERLGPPDGEDGEFLVVGNFNHGAVAGAR